MVKNATASIAAAAAKAPKKSVARGPDGLTDSQREILEEANKVYDLKYADFKSSAAKEQGSLFNRLRKAGSVHKTIQTHLQNRLAKLEKALEKERKKNQPKPKWYPKRALTNFMFFSIAEREKVKASQPDLEFEKVGHEVSVRWKALADRSKFDAMAAQDKERYKREVEEFAADPAAFAARKQAEADAAKSA